MKARRKVFSLVLTLAIAMGMFSTVTPVSKASTKAKSLTMLTGESVPVSTLIGTIKSVSSSNKKVATVKKNSLTQATINAKKAGKATITIKGTNGGRSVYKVTVKKLNYSVNVASIAVSQTASGKYNSQVAFEIVNNSGVCIDSSVFSYGLMDATGNIVESKTFEISYLLPGIKYYKVIDYSYQDAPVVQAAAEYSSHKRSTYRKYYNMNNKTDISLKTQTDTSMSFTFQNKSKKTVYACAQILFYNASGEIIYARDFYETLSANAVKTDTLSYLPEGCVDFRIIKHCYSYDLI